MQIRELLEKRAQLIAEARQLQDKADAEERSLTAEESANFDKYLDDAAELRDEADRLEKLATAEKSLSEIRKAEPISLQKKAEKAAKGPDEDAAMRAFEAFLEPRRATAEARAMQADLDASGGYIVAPPQFINRLIKFVDDLIFFRQLATVIPVTSSDSITAPSLETDVADSAWTAEIGSLSEDSSLALGARSLSPHQLTKLLKVSDKLMMVAAVPVEQLVRERLAYKVADPQETAFMTGTGAGQPLGVFTASASGISTSRDVSTGNTTTSIQFDGLKECKYTLKSQYWPRANWIFHRDAVKQISKLKDGEGQYIWQSAVVGGDPDRLLGFPVRVSEFAPNTFTTGLYVGILGDFSKYWIAELQGVQIKRLDELYAGTSQVGFVIKVWVDGMPVLEEAFNRVTLA